MAADPNRESAPRDSCLHNSGLRDSCLHDAGLRERKKASTREALAWAAIRLAAERGLENVRVDDIAEEAGVSTRTYNNYFSSREEAICAASVERARRVGDALLARPTEEPLHEAIVHAVVDQHTRGGEPGRTTATHLRLIIKSPALRGEMLKGMEAGEANLAEAIAERSGTDPEQDPFPRILAAAVFGASRVAVEYWLRPGATAAYRDLLREAVTIAAGIARTRGDTATARETTAS